MSPKPILKADMKELKLMEWGMEREYFITIKEVNMLDSGNKIKWMAKESSTILTIKLLMMASGRKISFKVMALFTMKKLGFWMFLSIIKIGRMLTSIGLDMKVISYKTLKTDKESYSYPMMRFLREISRKIWFGEKGYLSEKMEQGYEVYGKKTN
jgi:hypothetical protein